MLLIKGEKTSVHVTLQLWRQMNNIGTKSSEEYQHAKSQNIWQPLKKSYSSIGLGFLNPMSQLSNTELVLDPNKKKCAL